MPVKATFFDAKPRLAFRPVVEDLMGRATRMDVAVAFITKAGVDLLCKWAKLVEPKNCRVCVSGQFPTDLAELVRLHKVIGDQLHIHLRSGPEEEVGSSRLSPLFHSKIIWTQSGDSRVSIFVGSHNWTACALDGVNLEASTRIDCEKGDSFEQDVKSHIDACVEESDVFDPNKLDFYRSLQVRLYSKGPAAPEPNAIDAFEQAKGIVIHAEDHWQEKKPDSLLMYLPLADRQAAKWFRTTPTTVYLFLYPPGALGHGNPPSGKAIFYEGRTTAYASATAYPLATDPETGKPVNCEISNVNRPEFKPVAGGNTPTPQAAVLAQAVATVHRVGAVDLPVYIQGKKPNARVTPVFEPVGGNATSSDQRAEVPMNVQRYFTPQSIRDGAFVFFSPIPHYSVSIKVPGKDMYLVAPAETVQRALQNPASIDEVCEMGEAVDYDRQFARGKFGLAS